MINPSDINTIDTSQSAPLGLIETIKTSVQPDIVAHKFGVDKNLLIDIGVYGSIGFIAGYLLKKYSEYFVSLLFLVIALVVLQQFDYVAVLFNYEKINEVFGLNIIPFGADSCKNMLFEWMKSNVPRSASLIVGFLIGLKVG